LVLLPSHQDDPLLLPPFTGASGEIVAVHKKLTDLLGLHLLQPILQK
jgi:hypothetical protein